MKKNELFDPPDMRLFGREREMPKTGGLANLIQKFAIGPFGDSALLMVWFLWFWGKWMFRVGW